MGNRRLDGYQNFVAGLKTKREKATNTEIANAEILTQQILNQYYLADGLATKIVDSVAEDMTKNWVKFEGKKSEEIAQISDDCLLDQSFTQALKYARLSGGSLILVYWDDGRDLAKPVNWNKAKFSGLKVIEKANVNVSTSKYYTDSKDKKYGKIFQYEISFDVNNLTKRKLVHEERILMFEGERVPEKYLSLTRQDKYFGLSVLQFVFEQLQALGTTFQNTNNILYEFVVNVYKFEDLKKMLSNKDREKALQNRMEIIDMTKSVINAVLLGKDDDFSRLTANTSGLDVIIDRFMMWLSSVCNIPVTKLFGRSPAGQNSTGEGDMENYYSFVRGKQRSKMLSPLRKLINQINLSEFGESAEPIKISLRPLRLLTEKEISEKKKIDAEADKIFVETLLSLVNTQIITAEEADNKIQEYFKKR